MPHSLIDASADDTKLEDERVFGVAIAQVISNLDLDRLANVQLRFPWLPGVEPWARVALPMAGDQRGTYFIPQEGDEVLVAFNHGDIREPYIVGSLWNGEDKPPAEELDDPINKRLIRTPAGHELLFDDREGSITITNTAKHRVQITKESILIEQMKKEKEEKGKSSSSKKPKVQHRITLDGDGIRLEAIEGDITLSAPKGTVKIDARAVDIKSKGQTEVQANADCVVKGQTVRIN